MATIGLDKLFYAPITESLDTGEETYGTPIPLAKAISAELSVEVAEAILYADDGASEIVKEFKSGTLTLGIDDLGHEATCALTGASVDSNGVLVASSEDSARPVAIGFRAARSTGVYEYFWFYRVTFALPSQTLNTKADSITFATPSIEGTILRRTKVDQRGKHPWKASAVEGARGVKPDIITSWYTAVYEPATDPAHSA